MSGWISLDRAITKHWLWQGEKFTKGQAWVDLLLFASHTDHKVLIKGYLIPVGRGEQIRSQVTLSKAWGWDRKTVSRFLKLLEKDAMIVTRTDHLTSYISICNYSSFQGEGRDSPQLKGQLKGQHTPQACPSTRPTINKGNKGKNENNDNNNDAFSYFWLNMKLKKAAKPKAELSFNKHAEQADDEMEFAKMLVEDTKERSLLNQFGFDKLNPTTYLNQNRWEDDKPANESEKYKYVLDSFNEEMKNCNVPFAESMTRQRVNMVKHLFATTDLNKENISNYFGFAATSKAFDWARGETGSNPRDMNYFLSEEAYYKARESQ